MENMGIEKFVEELKELNPGAKFETNEPWRTSRVIYGTVTAENLQLPTGYFWHYGYGSISNKGNTQDGYYESFVYEYDISHFENKMEPKQPKKSLFARIFG